MNKRQLWLQLIGIWMIAALLLVSSWEGLHRFLEVYPQYWEIFRP